MGKAFNLDQQSELFIITNKKESIYSTDVTKTSYNKDEKYQC